MKKKHQKIKRTAKAHHGRRVHLYGWSELAPSPVGIAVQTSALSDRGRILKPGAAVIAWVNRGELRKLQRAIAKILGPGRRRR